MDNTETSKKLNQQEKDEESTWQFKLVLTIIGIGIIVWILEFAGVFH
jgi:hypothetical protein